LDENHYFAGGVSLKPIALTEWNLFTTGSKQMTSYIAGMHATMVLGELLKISLEWQAAGTCKRLEQR